MAHLLGIDIGTTNVKAVLFDPETSRITAVAGREYPIHKPAPNRAEQDPDDWWRATVAVVQQVAAGRDVIGIGLSGQMHGATLLNREGKPLHPSIIWADQRSADQCAQLVEPLGAERYTAIAGTMPAAGFLGPTLLWLKQHQPDLLDQTYQTVFPKDYVRLHLTGEIATDLTDAAGSGIFNVQEKVWAAEILNSVGLPGTILPVVLASAEVAGKLTPQAAETLGLKPGIPVVAGCADQPAQAIGNGVIRVGIGSVTTGTGGQVSVPVKPTAGHVRTDPRLHVFNNAVPDMWYILGAILAAGLCLRWLRNTLGMETVPDAYPRLSAEAAATPLGADGLLFQPYLAGERTPHMDPLARGSFVGLNLHHTRGHLARAVMEGVAFALRQTLEISLNLGGNVETLIAAGGGGESPVWRQIQADVFGIPLQQTMLTEQASVGAAVLAGVGAGVYSNVEEASNRIVRYGAVTPPDPQRHARYNELYAQFLELYPRLREDFHRLTHFSSRQP